MNRTLITQNKWMVRAGIAVCAAALAGSAVAERNNLNPALTWIILFGGVLAGLVMSSAKPWREWVDHIVFSGVLTAPLALIAGFVDHAGMRLGLALVWMGYVGVGVMKTHYVPGSRLPLGP